MRPTYYEYIGSLKKEISSKNDELSITHSRIRELEEELENARIVCRDLSKQVYDR